MISLVASFGLRYIGGFALNLMALVGLALGARVMVDGFVVVLENIFRRQREHGEPPTDAAVRGTGSRPRP